MLSPAFLAAKVSVLLSCSCTIAAISNPNVSDVVLARAFKAFITTYGRHYASKSEEEERFAIFKESFEFVSAENSKEQPYRLVINEFADQTREEFGAMRLGLVQPPLQWTGLPLLGTDRFSGKTLPEAVDWTKKGAVTSPKAQKQCGSCWAFSTTGALEGAWKLASGKLVSLSEQQLVDCSKNGNNGCHGGSMPLAFSFLKKVAVCTEDSYPYTATDGKCHQDSCKVAIPRGSVIGFRTVPAADGRALQEAVGKQPVSVSIEADQKVFQLYSGGVLTTQCGVTLNHGVLLVGYGTEHGLGYWKVKNSWGAAWGEKGYIRLERGNSTKKYSPGECGINLAASYPVVKAIPGSLFVSPELGQAPALSANQSQNEPTEVVLV
mmetsp:Transcript_111023/g.220855  ORF Transcript_111023/g.220855 Transcript_111023/m.220855 type:complete len:379 (+) Transcript_111023:62-1198(+)